MFEVEVIGISHIDEMHRLRKTGPGQLEKQVIMVLHQAIDVNEDPIFLMGFPEAAQEEVAIGVGKEDRLPSIASRGDVKEGSRIIDSQALGHGVVEPN
jgi:hypothetical protein